jgi:hypothetical protein
MKNSSRREFLHSSLGGLGLLAMPEDLPASTRKSNTKIMKSLLH